MAKRTRATTDKRTPERFAGILACLRAGNTRRQAAAFVEISPETFYRWLDEEPGWREQVEKAEAEHEARMLDKVVKAAVSGEAWQAAAWWLERRRREDYGRRENVELTGKDGGPIQQQINSLNDHEKAALADAIRVHLATRPDHEAEPSPTATRARAGD